jgi:hypothetical protein
MVFVKTFALEFPLRRSNDLAWQRVGDTQRLKSNAKAHVVKFNSGFAADHVANRSPSTGATKRNEQRARGNA